VCVECLLIRKQKEPILFKVTEPSSVPYRVQVCLECVLLLQDLLQSCSLCLIGKQKKPILFKVTEPSSVLYRLCDFVTGVFVVT